MLAEPQLQTEHARAPDVGLRPAHDSSSMFFLLLRLALVASLALAFSARAADVTLKTGSPVATAGYYQVVWETTSYPTRLVEASDESFDDAHIVYAGVDIASTMSGKPDGVYFYRLESVAGDGSVSVVSNTLKVTVEHHPLSRALAFFAVGAIVFLSTLGLILFGDRRGRG